MKIKVEQQDDGLWLAERLEPSGLLAWGDTREEALANLRFLEARLSAHSSRPQATGHDNSKDDLPNQIHMALCAFVPIAVFFVATLVFKWPSPLTAALCFVSGVASMFVLVPITAMIYMGIARIKYGEIPHNARVATTDAGCSSLVFVVLFLILFPAFQKARQSASNPRKANAIRQQARP